VALQTAAVQNTQEDLDHTQVVVEEDHLGSLVVAEEGHQGSQVVVVVGSQEHRQSCRAAVGEVADHQDNQVADQDNQQEGHRRVLVVVVEAYRRMVVAVAASLEQVGLQEEEEFRMIQVQGREQEELHLELLLL
jgi:hypothetical protein